ncbi:MAG: kinase [Planctomycetota bacterium]|nr:MAG: kinase [Planctomycetota bacterium]
MSNPEPWLSEFCRQRQLPPSYAADVERCCGSLIKTWAQRAAGASRPLVMGINGAQGSGKSTLAEILELILSRRYGLRCARLSIDDCYLGRAQRESLAAEVHPLFATRGVPGTHEIGLAEQLFSRLADAGPIALPRFNKATDDRMPAGQWPQVAGPIQLLLFEGWCIGCRPQPDAELASALNRLESEEDASGVWRRAVNAELAGPYARLWQALDGLIMLRSPDWPAVRRWRGLQEQRLAATHTGQYIMDDAALDRFVEFFERLTRWQWQDLPSRSDLVISLDADHRMG